MSKSKKINKKIKPMHIQILSPEIDDTRKSVQTWWYENNPDNTLIIEYTNGDTEKFTQANVVKRY